MGARCTGTSIAACFAAAVTLSASLAGAAQEPYAQPQPSAAQPAYPPPQPQYAAQPTSAPVVAERWFGWQTLIVMGAGTVLTPLFGVGLGGLYLGPPIVHWAHGQVGEGFLVLGISTALGAGGAVGGLLVACSGELGCSGGDIDLRLALSVAGAGLGMLIAGIIDVAAFTYEPDPGSAVGVRVVPHFAVTSDHAVVGIAGVL